MADWCVTGQTYCRVSNPTRQVTQTSKPDGHYAHLARLLLTPTFVSKTKVGATYTDSKGNTIVYYCIQTVYLENESGGYTGLDINAIGLAIDLSQIENKRECTVNGYDAFQCEIADRAYLCWTLSPEISCVIDYDADTVNEDSIIKMAESVPLSVE